MIKTKLCSRCKQIQPITNFRVIKSGRQKGQLISICIKCLNFKGTEWRHKNGKCKAMNENKECSSYLGVFIAEKVLSTFFKHIERMPYGNPGYDFKCDKGYKIDVKSACLHFSEGRSPKWSLHINKNIKPNYFLFLLFNNRKYLEPIHVLLVPGELINSKQKIAITNTPKGLSKWIKYMQSLDKVITCCNLMKEEAKGSKI